MHRTTHSTMHAEERQGSIDDASPRTTKLRAALAVACALLLSACAAYGPGPLKPGDDIAAARERMGAPTGEYARPEGGSRLEFARGPYGKDTFMLDFDAAGKLLQSDQVLDDAHFDAVRAGMTKQQVLYAIGRPAEIWGVRYHDQTVWSYRYFTPSCRLFHVGITPAGVVEDTSYGPDPLCERRDKGLL